MGDVLMQRSDVLVEVRNRNLVRVGMITPRFLKLKATLRWCDVGDWELELPGNHPMVPFLAEDGSGIVVSLYGVPHFSGMTSSPKRKRDRQNPDGSFTFVGVTDEIILHDALAFPQPANPDPSTQLQANDVRSGAIETLMYQYVRRNIGDLAPAGRRRGIRAAVAVGADSARGGTAQKSPRFQNLLELEQELAILSGTLGFRVVQVGASLRFDVVAITDRRSLVRLDIENGTITSEEIERSAPTITYAIVGGQGSGTDRQIITRTTADSLAAETSWGRPIERFIDQRDTNELMELQQSGDEALLENGFTATSVKVIPSDDQTMRYAIDWREGDLITVVVDNQETSTTVTAAALLVNDSVCIVGAAIGNVTGFDKSAALTQRVEDVEKRMGRLERSAEIGDELFVPALADPNADRILFWDDSANAYAWLAAGAGLSLSGTSISLGAHAHNAADITSGRFTSDRLEKRIGFASNAGSNPTNWNDATENGWYTAVGATNAPNSNWMLGEVIAHDSTWVIQRLYEFTAGGAEWQMPVWRRRRSGGAWGAWARVREADDDISAMISLGMDIRGLSRRAQGKSTGTTAYKTINFPAGLFWSAPSVVATPYGNGNVAVVHISGSPTATSFTYLLFTLGGAAYAGNMSWVATQ
jgi:hypothetical protein